LSEEGGNWELGIFFILNSEVTEDDFSKAAGVAKVMVEG